MSTERAIALQAQLSALDSRIRAAESQRNLGAGAFVVGVVLLFVFAPLGVFILIIALLAYFQNKGKVNKLEGERTWIIGNASK